MRILWAVMLVAILVSPLSIAEQGRRLFVVAKSGVVFNVASQKLVGQIKLNEKPPASIMRVSFDPVANNLYIVDQPFLEHGGIFVIDAKSLRQKKFLAGVQHVTTEASDEARQLEIMFSDIAKTNESLLVDRISLKLGKGWIEYPWIDCLNLSKHAKRRRELFAERSMIDKTFFAQGCFSRDSKIASQIFIGIDQPSYYAFRQIGLNKASTPLTITSIGVQEGECAMNVEKAICWPWQLSKQSRAELIDLSTGQIRKIPTRVEDAPIGPAAVLATGKDFIVLQVGNNATDYKYYIASDSNQWDLKPYDDLNKVKGEWLVSMYEIENR